MSFPYLSDIVKSLTGVDLPLPFATFGLFVACAMFTGAACLAAELQRMHELGTIQRLRRRDRTGNRVETSVSKAPHELVSNLTFVVMLAGIAGARLFHILEHTDQFLASPWTMIASRSGLSVFGGLIFGTAAGALFIRRWKLPLPQTLDAVAPAMMLGYAIGRLGCQISGDGDWGIQADLALKPYWLPDWLWAQTYENNIYGAVIPYPGVYPTSVYESVLALLCFGILWILRKHPFKAGWLFSVYLILAGLERLLIEQIRVNPVYSLGAFHASQAEIIATGLIAAGLAGIAVLGGRRNSVVNEDIG